MGDSTLQRRLRALVAGSLVVGAIGGSTVGTINPASAAPRVPATPTDGYGDATTDSNIVVGDFFGDRREEHFVYVPGPDPDYLVWFSKTSTGDLNINSRQFSVNRHDYRPVAGDFDGDGKDELLWYAPGVTQDQEWNFTSSTTFTRRFPKANGWHTPLAGDFTGDGVDDIFWYGPGDKPDSMWLGRPGGRHKTVQKRVGGKYTPIVGSFGSNRTDDIFWYGPGGRFDTFWDFNYKGQGRHRADRSWDRNRYYEPISYDAFGDGWRGGDILWYAPGSGFDPVWDFLSGNRVIYEEYDLEADGQYQWLSGDLLGDGEEDIFWYNATEIVLWDHRMTNEGLVRNYYIGYLAAPASTEAGTFSTSETGSVPYDGTLTKTREELTTR